MSKRRRRVREKQLRHALTGPVRPRTLVAGSGLAVAATLVSGSVAIAASTIEVDNTTDNGSLSACTAAAGDCSLRGAITLANSDPGSTITFASSVTGTITLGSALPALTAGESIEGPGAKVLTIDENHVSSAIRDESASPVTIAGLTIANGRDIALDQTSSGQLSLSNIALQPDEAGTIGVFAGGALVVNESTFSGGGVGIWTQAGLTMDNSTVSGNTNAGVRIAGSGGATIENSTISANSTGIEVYAGQLDLNSTIVAGSSSHDVSFRLGTSLAGSFSLIQDTSGVPARVGGGVNNLDGADPQLGPLGDHGGPTKTVVPALGSPVVDKGKDYTTTGKDQRGVAIVDDPAIANAADGRDIGAVEQRPRPSVSALSPSTGNAGDTVSITGTNFTGATAVKFGSVDATSFTVISPTQITATAPPGNNGAVDVTVTRDTTSATGAGDRFTYPTFNVDTTSDSAALNSCTPAPSDCSLRGAINGANQSAGSTITFAPGVTGSITLASDLPILAAGETVEGPGAEVLAIDGADQFRGLRAETDPGDVDISGLTATRSVYGVYSTGSHLLTLTRMAVSNNKPTEHGIRADSDLAIDQSTISGNDGLGVEATAGLSINNSTVTGNGQGGVYVGVDGTIANSTISTNGGPGISTYSGAIRLRSTIVAGNTGSDVSLASGHGATLTENFSLIQNDTGLTLEAGSGQNLNGQSPLLGPLADNGGPTRTMKPSNASPVLDKGKDLAGTGLDQRGTPLTDLSAIPNAADGRDIGAVELAIPQVTHVTPSVHSVRIDGQGFTGATAVKFGGTDATSFTVDSDTQISAVVPPGSGTVDVTVTGADGSSTTSAADRFTYPKTLEVDTTLDGGSLDACTPAPDDCNLRGAITVANGAPGSTITFASSVTGTITLGSSLPVMSAAEKLHGPGPGVLTIDAHQYHGLRVSGDYDATEISGLTVTGGYTYQGGGIYSIGDAPLSLSNMNVSGNTAQYGSAIYTSESPLTIDRSTISGNSTVSGGSAVFVAFRTLTMTNSTVSGNPTGGVESEGGTIENSTIAANGGTGVVIDRNSNNLPVTLNLKSSIVAGNTGSDVKVGTGTAKLSENFSLIQNLGTVTPDPATSGNNANGFDPQLGALADNGGPTRTMKPSGASPVIDAGQDYAGTGHDQRGRALPDLPAANASDGRDIGAVELAPPTVSSLSPSSGDAGTTVTIAGAGFGDATGVQFGSANAASFSIVDATHITAVAPAGSGAHDVTVTGPDGVSPTSGADRFTYSTPTPTPDPTPGPDPTPTPTPTPAADAAVLKQLKKGVFSATFVVKPKTLVFRDRLPEAGKATYTLAVAHRKGKKTQQLKLGTATATITGPKTVKVTIKLGKKGWRSLRHNPKGKLSLLTSFKRKVNSHVLKTTRAIKPKHRPKH